MTDYDRPFAKLPFTDGEGLKLGLKISAPTPSVSDSLSRWFCNQKNRHVSRSLFSVPSTSILPELEHLLGHHSIMQKGTHIWTTITRAI